MKLPARMLDLAVRCDELTHRLMSNLVFALAHSTHHPTSTSKGSCVSCAGCSCGAAGAEHGHVGRL
jgi:hypothetical protein